MPLLLPRISQSVYTRSFRHRSAVLFLPAIRSFAHSLHNNPTMPPLPKKQTAIQISRNGGPEVLEVVHDAPIPEPKQGEVLVQNTYAGVNYIDTVSYPALLVPNILYKHNR